MTSTWTTVTYRLGDRSRTDSWEDATPADVATSIVDGENVTFCQRSRDIEPYCLDELWFDEWWFDDITPADRHADLVLSQEPMDSAQMSPFVASNEVGNGTDFVQSKRVVAGVELTCAVTTSSDGDSAWCFSLDHMDVHYMRFSSQGMSFESETIEVTGAVSESDFILPYPIVDASTVGDSLAGTITLSSRWDVRTPTSLLGR